MNKMSSILDCSESKTTCRSCLQNSSGLFPLDAYPNMSADNSSKSSKSAGELMMACTKVKVAPDDGLPQNVCMKCISDLQAAFAYKAMCEDSDRKLRSLLYEVRDKVKLERFDERKNAEQETKIITDEHLTVTCLRQSGAESPELPLSPKDEPLAVVSTEFETKVPPSIAETTFVDQAIEDSVGIGSLDAWHGNDFEMSVNVNLDGISHKAPKQDVRSENCKRKPNKEKHFLCEFCSATFHSIGNLTTHYVTHTGRKDFICDICKRQYSTKACLKDHMRYHGDKSKLYCHLCPYCGKGFTYRNVLSEHIHVHTGERPYQCEVCNSKFNTKHNLRVHKRRHNPDMVKRFICKTCGKGFMKNDKLSIHIRTHTGERPYSCNVCNLAFSQNSTLKAHIRNHTGEKRYSCNICGERFIQNYQLISHRRKNDHWIPGTEPAGKMPKPKVKREKRSPKEKEVPHVGPVGTKYKMSFN